MSRHSIKFPEENSEINISPMIDMVFILLIFFIVTTVFVEEQGVDTDKPQPGVTSSENDEGPIKLHIASNGQISITDKNLKTEEIGINTVRSKVSERLRDSADLPVIIDVEANVVTSRMVSVIDEARIGGAQKVLVNPSEKR